MTDIEDSAPKKKLSLSRPGKLELKKTVEGGQVPAKLFSWPV